MTLGWPLTRTAETPVDEESLEGAGNGIRLG